MYPRSTRSESCPHAKKERGDCRHDRGRSQRRSVVKICGRGGIAMGMAGTDVARNAADMVLADDNFATIAGAIAQGRSIYENIRKSVLFLLSSNFGEIITMLAAVAMGLASPLKSSHILWINLITDSLPALALGVDVEEQKDYMNRPPRRRDESLFAGGGWGCTCFYGLFNRRNQYACLFAGTGRHDQKRRDDADDSAPAGGA